MKKNCFLIMICFCVSIIAFSISSSIAYAGGWFIFKKPAYKGKVIDAETKEPIEGAVVVAVYRKFMPMWPAGGDTSPFKVKETLTDKKGEFYFPPYTTVIQPLASEGNTHFIIYKPGYKTIGQKPLAQLNSELQEIFFSKGQIGQEGELEELDRTFKDDIFVIKTHKVTFGIVELPKAKTWEERNKANMISPTDDYKQWPLLFEVIQKEDDWLNKNKGWRN